MSSCQHYLWGPQGEFGCMPALKSQNAARRVAGLEAFQAAAAAASAGVSGIGAGAGDTPALRELKKGIAEQQQKREKFVVRNDHAVGNMIKKLQSRL